MNKRNFSAGTKDEQRTAADLLPSASLVQNGMLGEGTVTRKQIEALIASKKQTIQQFKTDIIQLERQALLMSDEEQWFTEENEMVTEKDGRKKNRVERLIGRVHWNENFKDESTGEVITIERSQVVRVDGNWYW